MIFFKIKINILGKSETYKVGVKQNIFYLGALHIIIQNIFIFLISSTIRGVIILRVIYFCLTWITLVRIMQQLDSCVINHTEQYSWE